MEDINYIKERYCQFKCPYKDNQEISLGKFDYDYYCDECGELNDIEVDQILDNICEYCQISSFIEEMKSYELKYKT